MMENPAVWAAATPAITFVGCAVSYYVFSGSPDDRIYPKPLRGDAENEPWGNPCNVTGKQYRFPGDRVRRGWVVPIDDTAQFAAVKDERNNDHGL